MGHSPCSSKSAKICAQFIRQQSMYMTSLYIYTYIMPLEVESAKPVKNIDTAKLLAGSLKMEKTAINIIIILLRNEQYKVASKFQNEAL